MVYNMATKSDALVCVKDFEIQASRNLSNPTYEYFAGGSAEEQTLQDNILAYRRLV